MAQADSDGRPGALVPMFALSALTAVHQGLNLLLLPVYLRYIAPAAYGTLAAVTIGAAVIAVASNARLDAAMRTFFFDFAVDAGALERYLGQVLSAAFWIAGGVFVVALLVGDPLYASLFAHTEVEFLPAGALALATASGNACLAPYFVYLRNSLKLRELVCWQLPLVLVTAGLKLTLVAGFGLGIYGVLWGGCLPAIGAALWLAVSQRRLLTPRIDLRLIEPSLRYSLPLVGLGFVYAIGARLDRFVLERNVDLATLGAYAILANLLAILDIVLNTVDNALRPYLYPIFRSARDSIACAAEPYQRLYFAAALLSLSLAVCIGANLGFVTDNATYLSMQRWLPLGVTASLPMILLRYYALIYDCHKRSGAWSIVGIVRLALLFAGLVVLVPRFAIGGVLAATLFAGLVTVAMFAFLSRSVFGAVVAWRAIGVQSAALLVCVWSLGAASGNVGFWAAMQLAAFAALMLGLNRRAIATALLGGA